MERKELHSEAQEALLAVNKHAGDLEVLLREVQHTPEQTPEMIEEINLTNKLWHQEMKRYLDVVKRTIMPGNKEPR